MATSTNQKETPTRLDLRALWIGIIFSLLFVGLIWLLGPYLDKIKLAPDQGASWYYWKLTNPTFWSRATVWGFYLMHQFSFWGLIYYAQTRIKKYSTQLHTVNYLALGLNALFILLRILQTQLWYDGLAQDVSIWSSQISVIILLVWVLFNGKQPPGDSFWKTFTSFQGNHSFCSKIPRILLCLGDCLHLLVSPHYRHQWSPAGLFLHVPAFTAGQPIFHPNPC